MSKTIEFIFDFGSPNAYLSYYTVTQVAERTGAALRDHSLPVRRYL